ncbi:MAG TPA: glycosyltransferase [Candidatus Kapabacteria bacterium]|nr:glycosyltransferase [Candidatus Kapabacteria bacterium]
MKIDNQKLNILFLTARFPYPLVGGDRVKPHYLLKYLSKNHNVTLVSFHQGDYLEEENIQVIENMGIEVHIIKLNPLKAAANIIFKNLFSMPLEIGYYYQPEFKNIVEQLFNAKKFDLCFAFFMRTAEYIKNKQIPKVLIAEDCRVLYQKRSYQESKKILQKAVRFWEYKMLGKYEKNIVNYFDFNTFVTEQDISSMKIHNQNANYFLLTNGTNIDHFKPNNSDISKRTGILFCGKLDIWANEIMLQRIIDRIFPLVQSGFADTHLNIVGANPKSNIKDLSIPKINLNFNVPDMLPFLCEARVFLHPHTGATGIQNKVLEAMACGCPVVTTPTGIQGIDAVHNVHCLIGESDEELAKHTIELLKNDDLADKISKNARQLIVDTHSWEAVYKQLDELISSI